MQQILTIISIGIPDGIDVEDICGTGQRKEGWLLLKVRAKDVAKRNLWMPLRIPTLLCLDSSHSKSIITGFRGHLWETQVHNGYWVFQDFPSLSLAESRMENRCCKLFALKK